MKLTKVLVQDSVKVSSSATSKKRLLIEISELFNRAYGMDSQKVFQALFEREQLGSTSVGHGVAIPHARLDNLKEIVAIFLKLETPLDFDAVDHKPVDLVFAILAPETAGASHLKALATVSRLFRQEDTRDKLRANSDEGALYMLLTEAPELEVI